MTSSLDPQLMALIAPGEWVELVATLSRKAAPYRVASVASNRAQLRSRSGAECVLTLPRDLTQCYGFGSPPAIPAHFDVQEGGILGAFDYRAGANGLPPSNRRGILLHVFHAPLKDLLARLPFEDTKRWGEAASALRLERMANRLAQRITNESQQSVPADRALRDWKSDSAWLKATLYDPSPQGAAHPFTWPTPYHEA